MRRLLLIGSLCSLAIGSVQLAQPWPASAAADPMFQVEVPGVFRQESVPVSAHAGSSNPGIVSLSDSEDANAAHGSLGANGWGSLQSDVNPGIWASNLFTGGGGRAEFRLNDIIVSGPGAVGSLISGTLNLQLEGSLDVAAVHGPTSDARLTSKASVSFTAQLSGPVPAVAGGMSGLAEVQANHLADGTQTSSRRVAGVLGDESVSMPGSSGLTYVVGGVFSSDPLTLVVGEPMTLDLSLTVGGGVTWNGTLTGQDMAHGNGLFNNTLSFPTSGRAFTLPAGYTVNSVSGLVSNNHFGTAPPTDATPPTTSVSLAPGANQSGWNSGNVTATLTAADDPGGSGVASTRFSIDNTNCGAPTSSTVGCSTYDPGNKPIVATEGKHTLFFFSTDLAGNAEAQKQQPVWIDKTPPTITFSGNGGGYLVDQTVSIACIAADPPGAGVASGIDASRTSCPQIAAPAYTFGLGTNSISGTAYDLAGNSASATTSFSVGVSYGSLCTLTFTFIEGSAKFQSLPPRLQAAIDKLGARACANLSAANLALTTKQKTAAIAAYQQLVAALSPAGWLTQAQANLLTSFSAAL